MMIKNTETVTPEGNQEHYSFPIRFSKFNAKRPNRRKHPPCTSITNNPRYTKRAPRNRKQHHKTLYAETIFNLFFLNSCFFEIMTQCWKLLKKTNWCSNQKGFWLCFNDICRLHLFYFWLINSYLFRRFWTLIPTHSN